MAEDGRMEHGRRTYKLVAVLTIIAMALIFFIGIQAPNDWALPITVGFLVLTGIVWIVFENKRFKGPPIGDEVPSARPRSPQPKRQLARSDRHDTGRTGFGPCFLSDAGAPGIRLISSLCGP